jgi:hypothetical protein
MSLTTFSPATAAGRIVRQALTVGVEEEFLLLDPGSWHNAPLADEARAALPEQTREQRSHRAAADRRTRSAPAGPRRTGPRRAPP